MRFSPDLTHMCSDQVRNKRILGTLVLFLRRIHLTIQSPLSDSSQIQCVGIRTSLTFHMSGSSPLLPSRAGSCSGVLPAGCSSPRWIGFVHIAVVTPCYTIKLPVIIHDVGIDLSRSLQLLVIRSADRIFTELNAQTQLFCVYTRMLRVVRLVRCGFTGDGDQLIVEYLCLDSTMCDHS